MFKWLFGKMERVTKDTPHKRWFSIEEVEKALSEVEILKDDIIEKKIKEETLKESLAKGPSGDKVVFEPSPDNVIKITESKLTDIVDGVASEYRIFFDSSIEHRCFQDNLSADIILKISETLATLNGLKLKG